jgi:hypothetical protein
MVESRYGVTGLELESPLSETKLHNNNTMNGRAAVERTMMFSWRFDGFQAAMGAILIFGT